MQKDEKVRMKWERVKRTSRQSNRDRRDSGREEAC